MFFLARRFCSWKGSIVFFYDEVSAKFEINTRNPENNDLIFFIWLKNWKLLVWSKVLCEKTQRMKLLPLVQNYD